MIVPSYFSTLASSVNMQALIDASQLNLAQQSMWRTWLDMGVPQMSLNFDTAIGRDRISAAASIVDSDAPAPLRSRNKLEIYKGKIPAIKEKFRMNQDDMRSLEVLKALPLAGGNNSVLVDFLNKDLAEASVAGDKRVDMMLLQAVSTLTVDVSTTNNPDGVAYGTISLLPSANQIQGVPKVWSDPTSTPIDDIESFIQINSNQRGRYFGSIKMPYEVWVNFKKTTQVKSYLGSFFNTGRANSAFAVTIGTINEYFAANQWPMVEIVNYVANVEVDGNPTFVKPFNINNVSFTPAGKLGILANAISMEDLRQSLTGKTYAKFGPTLVSKWCETDPLVEFTAMEMNAFPAINVDGIFILTTDQVQASFV